MNAAVNEISINGVDYVKKGTNDFPTNLSGDVRIVILQRGWVVVGRFSKEDSQCFLDNASVIRKWGTTKGLGEIVSGPTSETILDNCGHVEFHELGVVAMFNCNPDGWKKHV